MYKLYVFFFNILGSKNEHNNKSVIIDNRKGSDCDLKFRTRKRIKMIKSENLKTRVSKLHVELLINTFENNKTHHNTIKRQHSNNYNPYESNQTDNLENLVTAESVNSYEGYISYLKKNRLFVEFEKKPQIRNVLIHNKYKDDRFTDKLVHSCDDYILYLERNNIFSRL